MRMTVSYPFGQQHSVSCGKLRKSILAGMFGFFALYSFVDLCSFFDLCCLGDASRLYAQGPQPGQEGQDSDRRDRRRGGRGGFDPSDFIRRLDQNGDGLVTESEIQQIPGPFRDRWTQQGLDFSRGVKVDDMISNSQRQMDEMRRSRDENGDRDRSRGFGRSDRPDFQPPPDMSQNRSDTRPVTPSPVSTSGTSRTRIVPLLPESYKSIDTDFDGQIALFEWRKARRGTISQFMQYDFNGDGFLTAKELAKAPGVASATVTPSSVTATPTPSTAAVSATPLPTSTAALPPVEVSTDAAIQASRSFDLLDSDRKGTVEGKEWDQSSRLKPLFQKAGYDLNKPLNKDEFTQAFVRVGAVK